jgi:tRNA threonylcarbamoyladenosine biosynthesis protein TsaB
VAPAPDAPPLILAVETAVAPGVALLRGEQLLGARACASPAAATLLPALVALLEASGVALREVGAFAISIGPGSFTGLRVGLATLKGLAFGSEAPAVAVPTLAALAAQAPPGDGPVVAALDARRGELYAAGFEDGAIASGLPEGVYAYAELAERLPAFCRLVGEGARLAEDAVRAVRGPGVSLHPDCVPTAEAVARIALRRIAAGERVAVTSLVPRYVRRAEAEVKRTGSRVEPGAADGRVTRPRGEDL